MKLYFEFNRIVYNATPSKDNLKKDLNLIVYCFIYYIIVMPFTTPLYKRFYIKKIMISF